MPHSGVAGPGASKMALPKDSQPLFQGEGGVQLSRMKIKKKENKLKHFQFMNKVKKSYSINTVSELYEI